MRCKRTFPIDWHKNNLKNMQQYYDKYIKQLAEVSRATDKLCKDIEFLDYQIKEAEKQNKKGFDSLKFKVVKHND